MVARLRWAGAHNNATSSRLLLSKIFVAMCQDSCGEICKYFVIDNVEESINSRSSLVA